MPEKAPAPEKSELVLRCEAALENWKRMINAKQIKPTAKLDLAVLGLFGYLSKEKHSILGSMLARLRLRKIESELRSHKSERPVEKERIQFKTVA